MRKCFRTNDINEIFALKLMAPLAVLSAVTLAGCATGGFVGTLVDQKAPTPDIGLLKPVEGIIVHSIDGKKVGVTAGVAGHAHEYEIGLGPGAHTAVLSYTYILHAPVIWYSPEPKSVKFEIKSNRKYIIKPGITSNGPGAIAWEPFVMDLTDNQKCWSVFLQSAFFYMKQDCRDVASANK